MPVKNYPAAVAYIVNLIVAAVVAFGFMSPTAAHAVTTGAVALTSLAVAVLVHPFLLAVATGAFQAFLVALGGFGFHLSDQWIAALVGLFAFAAAIITHHSVTPLHAHRAGTTVAALEAASERAR